MKNKPVIVLLTLSILIAACGQAPTPEPTATVPPTEVPTPEPQPTATEVHVESGFYAYSDDGWMPIFEDEMTGPIFLPEEMFGGDTAAMQLVQYGYFSAYDAKSMIMSAYAKVLPGELYRKIDFQLSENQNVICLPEKIDDLSISELSFGPTNGNVSFPPGPGNQLFGDVLSALNDNSYSVIVLESPVDSEIANPVHQLAMVCP